MEVSIVSTNCQTHHDELLAALGGEVVLYDTGGLHPHLENVSGLGHKCRRRDALDVG